MPTTADMLDDLLRAALEFEQPHMREQVICAEEWLFELECSRSTGCEV